MIKFNENSSSINIKQIFSFSAYSTENELFTIDLFIEKEYLNLYCTESEKNKKLVYICKVTCEELKKNKLLSISENLEQIFKIIKDLINNNNKIKNYPLIKKQTNEIILVIPINIGNLNNLMFKLIEKENNKKEIIDELNNEDDEKENDTNKLLNTINLIQKKLDEKENIIKNLENKIIEIES